MEKRFRLPQRLILCVVVMGSISGTALVHAAEKDGSIQLESRLGKILRARPTGADTAQLETDLKKAQNALVGAPDSIEAIIWVGRRLGYLWRMNEAIEVYSEGLKKHPTSAALYRHRGHRYISVRKLDLAIADLQKAVELSRDTVDVVEEDGQPNRLNVPLTTLKYNIFYHLGVAHYLKGDFIQAVKVFRQAKPHVRVFDDNRVAIMDWMYMSLRRMDRHAAAKSEIIGIHEGMSVIENTSYYRRLRMYAGAIAPDQLVPSDASELERATLLYGLGNWHRCNGDVDKAKAIFEKIVSGAHWPAFAYLAAEGDLVSMNGQ
jgi:tetratricopeptide (TPR) repeat protein